MVFSLVGIYGLNVPLMIRNRDVILMDGALHFMGN